MAPQPDLQKPAPDSYALVGDSWPQESEGSYHAAETVADDAATTAATQAQSAMDADSKMGDESGETADSVSGGYSRVALQLSSQGQHFTAISGWMSDAAGKIDSTKRHIRQLVRTGTQEIHDALDSETAGTPTSPSSSELIDKYRGEIAFAASKLTTDLDAIGHSLSGDSGASRTPTYVRASSSSSNPTVEQAAVHQGITGDQPQVAPRQLPEMPRAVTAPSSESASGASTPSAPAAPHSVNPTLSNLIGGGQGSTPTGSPGGTSTSSPHTPTSPSTPSTQAHQSTEQHQQPKAPVLSRIPSLPLDGLPAAAAESVATVVSAAAGHQLSTAPSTTSTQSVPVSTGITPGVPGTSPVSPMAPTPLTPIVGGGLTPPTVTQPTTPAPQGTPASPPAAPQQTPTRSPAADLNWIQRTYGLSPGIETPKHETIPAPALFVTELPEHMARLHRTLATLRQQFESAGWSQPLAVATIRRGFESKTVYVTGDGVSIHPHGVLLPRGVTPMGEMPGAPSYSELSGSIMVTDKLAALIPRNWEVETVLSTVPADEQHQSAEQYQELVQSGELLECTVSRGRDGVEADEAMSVFARAAIGSAGCGELDVESARLRAARWIGTQPVGYGEVLSRWYLSDAADAMSAGRWGDAVYCSEKYLPVVDTKRQVA